jgi:hypothetical protein
MRDRRALREQDGGQQKFAQLRIVLGLAFE